MEKIYPPTEFECSEHVDWKKHFETFNEKVGLSHIPLIQPINTRMNLKFIADCVNLDVDNEELKKLNNECSIHHLNVEGEADKLPPQSKLPRKDILKRVYLNEASKSELKTVHAKLNWVNKSDLGKRRKVISETLSPKLSTGYLDLDPGKDIIITIKVYQPFIYIYNRDNRSYTDKVRCNYELMIVGCQTLAQLKDSIICEHKKGLYGEIKDLEDLQLYRQINAEDVYPSAFIFIDGVFYCDYRHPNARDNSEVIREWAKSKKIGDFETADMTKVKLSDLKFRIGYPYVFQHIADCEHVLIFSDVRLLSKSDHLMSKDYPYMSRIYRTNKVSCAMCDTSIATVIVLDSDRLPNYNTYFCDQCFKSYLFVDGKRVGSFKAYPFLDRYTAV